MLITLQQPLVDFRSFIQGDTGRLSRPSWPLPLVGVEFVRGFGPIVPRHSGGAEGWPGEHAFCEVRSPEASNISLGRQGQLQSAYSRLFFWGPVVGRLEQGWYMREFGNFRLSQALNLIRKAESQGPPLARRYQRATTRTGMADSPFAQYYINQQPVIETGTSLFICQVNRSISNIPNPDEKQSARPLRRFFLDAKSGTAAWVFYRRRTPIILIHAEDWSIGRELRISLARWHAEVQALGFVLHFVRGSLCPQPGSVESDNLQAQIMHSLRVVVSGKKTHFAKLEFAKHLQHTDETAASPDGAVVKDLLSIMGSGITEALIQGANEALARLNSRPGIRRRLAEVQSQFPPSPSPPLWFCNVVTFDHDLFQEFRIWMVNPVRKRSLQLWDASRILPGEVIADTVSEHISRAAVILLFVSPKACANDDWCNIAEVAISRHKAGLSVVVPIMLRDANLSGLDFIDIKSLPLNGKPIEQWRSRNDAWRHVFDELEKLLPDYFLSRWDPPGRMWRGKIDAG